MRAQGDEGSDGVETPSNEDGWRKEGARQGMDGGRREGAWMMGAMMQRY